MTIIGIDVGGTSIKAARVADDDTVQEQLTAPTPVDGGQIADAVRAVASALMTDEVTAVGAVVPGSVDRTRGVVSYAANLSWRDVPLRDLLAAELGVPVVVDHDVTAAAIAESRCFGDDGDLLYVALGTGIGGTHVVDGALRPGARGLAGEIGHIPVYPDGESCPCGQRGCLEVYASAAGVARRYAAAGGAPGLGAADVSARLAVDPVAADIWQDAVRALGLALACAVLLLDPGRIVLGGGLAQAGDALLVPVRTALAGRLAWRPAPPVEPSAFGLDSGIRGGVLLARRLGSTPPSGKAGYPQ